ncbi:B-cell receptor CD22-like isoform X8 [Megalobrama amblycephala]|uniref:B-cell receptor CD22-like isoform X8 n=1 Tax=Megalobrama amblycephala TaxID=75352 RepID=UPI002014048D|nr:B-cell receptor CD22-like isoform X8 [Megalobrama amblycephala]
MGDIATSECLLFPPVEFVVNLMSPFSSGVCCTASILHLDLSDSNSQKTELQINISSMDLCVFQVSAVEWLHEKSPEKEVRVSQDPAFEGRVELQADAGNCSLLLRDVNESDAGLFRFVLGTGSGRNWTNAQGIRLEVTDAEVEVKTQSDNVTEGDWIVFICGSCIPSMTVPTYIWKKDGHLHSQRHGENLLDLESVGLEDRGQYSCTMSGHEGLNSTSVNITVRPGYPPKSISVSISPSGEIVEGDSVILSCNSDAKPPAEISWYKGKTFLQSGDTYSISNIKSEASGNYYCSARNKYGSQSSAAVNVMYPPKSVSVSINPSGEIVSGDSVTLNCSSDSNPPALNFSWFKEGKSVGSGRIFSISNISSDHSGEYKCRSRNKHGEKNSDTVMLNVMYPPKSVSVSISPSGEIVSGDSVTLNCSSDSKPPAEISWFKGGTFLGSGDTYSISNIKSEASGNYYCSARNKHGSQSSAAVTVNVMYPPKSVSVSINPSGEIVSGDSVTLNCSSDSNPPALNFSWFKEGKSVGSGRIFSISNISSDHSGEYKCRSRNKHGEKNSDTVMLNVMYPPKSVSVSISPSGEIVSGDSVTLNCSSDSNPPAEISWFKEDETSAVGSGQSFSISSFNSSFSGRFYCEAQNKYGSQRSASVSLTVKGVQRAALHTVSGIVAGCGGLIFIISIIIFIMSRMRREGETEDVNQKQTADASDDTYAALDPASRTSADIYSTIASVQSRAPDDTYTALELQSRSSEYETLAVTSADPH